MITFRSPAKFDKQATLILVEEEQLKNKKFSFNNSAISSEILVIAKAGNFSGAAGTIYPIQTKQGFVVAVGVGKNRDLSLTALRINIRKVLCSAYLKDLKNVEVVPSQLSDSYLIAVIEGILLGTYKWHKYLSKDKNDKTVHDKSITIAAPKKAVLTDAITICSGVTIARDLINENADVANSAFIEKTVRQIVKGKKNTSLTVLNEKELKAEGLNLILAVNRSSKNEPKLIIVKYNGASSKSGYTALVGKGMTFDTGGLNLKPTGSIETMRCDMSGAAAVVGTLKNTIELGLKKNVLFVMSVAENVTGADSYKPGDIFTGYAGKSVEIGNTDAEGRLVLADAISYVVKNYKPARLLDIATLTGACVIALGHDYIGLVSTDDKFARHLIHSSNNTDDRAWRLPSYPELKDSVRSPIADIKNIGFSRGAGGAITAAEFLRQFTDGITWAHLDIAGAAFVDGENRMYFDHGGTGAGVRLLTDYLKNH